ncbi:PQQ-binding-like beta-propeller repeat protein [Halosimplex aquaticum]|uniref:PQQ-binding-like beta-propeller repeat protein n=1 Tax=Halosimplex aquaticum TaxID=3026162 RepID=A0ABD5XW04_9EURY|nr:PQQ-binding-like beta-propeller repeat protein [Halosimplex aquaticum]
MERSLRRRSLLRAAGVAGAVALAGCPAGIGESTGFEPGEADWPSYRFDACNNGVHPSAPGPGGDLSLAWTATYREDAGAVPGMGQVSSPIVLDGTVAAAANVQTRETAETVVAAFGLESGERRWERSFPLTGEGGGEGGASAQTLVSDGERLVVATRSDGWALRALSPSDGETEWEHALDTPTRAPITADSGSLVLGDQLYAVYDADDGSQQSRYETDQDRKWRNRYPPTVTEDTVFATAHDEIRAVDRESGEARWTASNDFYSVLYQERGAPFNSPVVVDGVAYAVCGRIANRDTGGMVAIDVEDGSQLWTAIPEGDDPANYEGDPEAFEQAAFYGIPFVLDDTVYAQGMGRGEWGVFAVDAADGAVERTENVGGLFAADGVVYGASGGDRLSVSATDPAADEKLGTATVDEWDAPRVGPQAIAGEYFLVATSEGIAAFGPN